MYSAFALLIQIQPYEIDNFGVVINTARNADTQIYIGKCKKSTFYGECCKFAQPVLRMICLQFTKKENKSGIHALL